MELMNLHALAHNPEYAMLVWNDERGYRYVLNLVSEETDEGRRPAMPLAAAQTRKGIYGDGKHGVWIRKYRPHRLGGNPAYLDGSLPRWSRVIESALAQATAADLVGKAIRSTLAETEQKREQERAEKANQMRASLLDQIDKLQDGPFREALSILADGTTDELLSLRRILG